MSSREKILAAVLANKFEEEKLPEISFLEKPVKGLCDKFFKVLEAIGGNCLFIHDIEELREILRNSYGSAGRIINSIPGLAIAGHELVYSEIDPASLYNVELAIIRGRFGVAENGAVWVSDEDFEPRVLPFICQHLAVLIDVDDIVPTMHEAYQLLEMSRYRYGTFIAGPSKTADIEQSLVIGAHGPRSMKVFVLLNQ